MVYSAISDDTQTVSQFTRRKNITITTNGTSTPADYQVKLTIVYEPEMQADFDDIRFNTKTDGYINYWIESYVASTSAVVWVELPNAITHPGSDDIWMYYGNAGLSDGSNIEDTFVFGDDFNRTDSSDLGAKWAEYGDTNWAIKNNALYHPDVTVPESYVLAKTGGALYSASDLISQAKINQTVATNADALCGVLVRGNGLLSTSHRGYGLTAKTNIATSRQLNIRLVWSDEHSLPSRALNEWWYHEYEVYGNTQKGKVWEYGTSKPITPTSSEVFATSASGYVGIFAGIDTGTIECYIDDFFIRKYITNEPTPSYGTPQHQRRTPQFM